MLSRSIRALLWVAAFVPVLPACAFDAALPTGTAVTCAGDSDCPEGRICSATLGRCVGAEAATDQPPTVVDAVVSPARARAGDIVTVRFSVDGALARTPVLWLDTGVGSAPVPLLPPDGTENEAEDTQTFRGTYTVTGSEAQGTRVISATLTSGAGLEIPGLLVGEVTLDFAPPRLVTATASAARIAAGTELVVLVEFDEPLAAGAVDAALVHMEAPESVVALDAAPTELDAPSTAWRLVATPAGAELEGPYGLRIAAGDAVGNTRVNDGDLEVVLDFTPPEPVLPNGVTTLDPVSPNRPISVSLALTEATATPPVLWARPLDGAPGTDGSDVPFAPATTGGVVWFFTGALPQVAPEGEYELVADDLVDEARNAGAETTLHRFTFDKTPPLLRNFSPLSAFLRGDSVLTVSFDVTEPLVTDPAVRLGDVAMTRDPLLEAPAYRYTLDLSTTAIDGLQLIDVVLEDRAHNVTADRYGVIQVDGRGPDVLAASFLPAAARADAFVVLTVVVDESLATAAGGTPALTLNFRDQEPTLAHLSTSGFTHTYGMLVGPATVEGSYTLESVALEDEAGNSSLVMLTERVGGAPTLVVDRTAPAISGAALNALSRSAAPGFDDVVLTFDSNEDLDAAGARLTVGAPQLAFTCASRAPTSPNYTCAAQVDAAVPEEQTVVTIEARDAAGNGRTAALPLAIDHSAPSLLDASFIPAVARAGTFVTLTLVTNEPLAETAAGAPDVQFTWSAAGDPGLEFLSRSGGTYSFGFEVVGSVADGAYTLTSVRWKDRVGNAATLDLQAEGPPSVQVIQTGPRILNAAINARTRSAAPNYSALEVTFDTNASLDAGGASLAVHLAGRPLACGAFSTTSPSYTCTTQVEASDPPGQQVVTVEAQDAAGNLTTAGLAVWIDHTPPALEKVLQWKLKPPSVVVPHVVEFAVPGSTGTLMLRTLEELDANDSILKAVSSSDAAEQQLFTFRSQNLLPNGDVISFWELHVVEMTAGDYTVEAALHDVLGNVWQGAVALPFPGLTVAEGDEPPCFVTRDEGTATCTDFDGDGHDGVHAGCPQGDDCNDMVASAYLGALEVPGDGVDNDCAGDGDTPLDNQSAVFVSLTGSPSAAGTMEDPLSSVETAATRAGTSKVVALRAGTYNIAGSAVVQRGIVGGLSETWEQTTSSSVLTTTRTLTQLGSGALVSMRGRSYLGNVTVESPGRALAIADSAQALIMGSAFSTTDTASGNGKSTVDVQSYSSATVRTRALFVGSSVHVGGSDNEGITVDPAAAVRLVDSTVRSNTSDAVRVSGEADLVRSLVESSANTAVHLTTYARRVTLVSSVVRSLTSGFFGRGIRLFTGGASVEGFFSTVEGGSSAISMNDNTPSIARCVACVVRGGVAIKTGNTFATTHSAYLPPCAVSTNNTCLSTDAVINTCDPGWCTEARDNAVLPMVLEEPSLSLPVGTPIKDRISSFEALGAPSSAVLDFAGRCRGAGELEPGAHEAP